jgi:hypothetical protein
MTIYDLLHGLRRPLLRLVWCWVVIWGPQSAAKDLLNREAHVGGGLPCTVLQLRYQGALSLLGPALLLGETRR